MKWYYGISGKHTCESCKKTIGMFSWCRSTDYKSVRDLFEQQRYKARAEADGGRPQIVSDEYFCEYIAKELSNKFYCHDCAAKQMAVDLLEITNKLDSARKIADIYKDSEKATAPLMRACDMTRKDIDKIMAEAREKAKPFLPQ